MLLVPALPVSSVSVGSADDGVARVVGEVPESVTGPAPGKLWVSSRAPTQSVKEAPGQLYPMLTNTTLD